MSIASRSVETAIGTVGVEATEAGIRRVRLPGGGERDDVGEGLALDRATAAAEQLAGYARGEVDAFRVDLDWSEVDPVHRRVLEALCELAPYGRTLTYGELGRAVGLEDAREIGVLMATNPLPLVVPCHRIVAADGLGGYGGGVELKRRLLELEGAFPASFDLGDV